MKWGRHVHVRSLRCPGTPPSSRARPSLPYPHTLCRLKCSYANALEDCRAAIAVDSNNVKAFTRGAKAAMALGHLAEAGELAQQGVLRDPRDEAARGERQAATLATQRLAKAREALVAREYDRALSLFNTLIESSPGAFEFALLKIEAQVRACVGGLKRPSR